MSRSLRGSLLQTVRRWLLPLGCYYATTLAVPFANGAARQGAIFASHALVVLVFPLLLIVLVCACRTSAEVCRRTGRAVLHSRNSSGGCTLARSRLPCAAAGNVIPQTPP